MHELLFILFACSGLDRFTHLYANFLQHTFFRESIAALRNKHYSGCPVQSSKSSNAIYMYVHTSRHVDIRLRPARHEYRLLEISLLDGPHSVITSVRIGRAL